MSGAVTPGDNGISSDQQPTLDHESSHGIALVELSLVIMSFFFVSWTASDRKWGTVAPRFSTSFQTDYFTFNGGHSVCYVFDKRVIEQVLVSMISLVSLEPGVQFHVFLVTPEWETFDQMCFVQAVAGTMSRVHFRTFDRNAMRPAGREPHLYSVKIFLCEILPQWVDRVLYLDTDTLVVRPVSHLFALNMTGKTLCGVNATDLYPRRWINSGVILYNLELMRKIRFVETTLQCLAKHRSRFVDDVWHTVCHANSSCLLPYRYNMMMHSARRRELAGEREQAVIFHFMKRAKYIFREHNCKIRNGRVHSAPEKRWMEIHARVDNCTLPQM